MILLTGGTGFLGSHLLKELVREGHKVLVLIRTRSSLKRIKSIQNKISLVNIDEFKLGEIFHQNSITRIIHAATSYGRRNESDETILNTNFNFPLELAQHGAKNEISTFYNVATSLPPKINMYSSSKKLFQDRLDSFEDSFKVIHLIPEYFYGSDDDDSKLITMLIKKMKNFEPEIRLTSCLQRRDFIHIDDVISGFMTLLKNESKIATLSKIPIGSGKSIRLNEIVTGIAELIKYDKSKLLFGRLPLRENEVMTSIADISILQSFGWEPRIDIWEGINRLIKSQ